MMMKIEDIVGDIILLILTENEPLKELGITQNKLFAKVVGYDGNGVWIENPDFRLPDTSEDDPNAFKTVKASILIAWAYISSIVHFPNVQGFDFPSPFDSKIGFDLDN
ncbi:MAG: hypothetical protein QF847_05075 [Candidatus Marinimicrobia bacterium]|jgi:hypothetical protein|nr:hypothetical protein [Candidatus Neomarinimicrobiota bacterium]|tara:strand:+ start:218 stop:541 length:324 start_codon:yes stop_codon:yes gene_type:complete